MKITLVDSMSHIRMRLEARERQLMRGLINDCMRPNRLMIWVWDAKGGNDRRREIFPNYKNRPPAPGQTYAQLHLMKELIAHTPAWQASHDGFEGDDVIAALVERFHTQASIEILTRDGDLTALCRPGVTCTAKAPVSPELVPLYKLTVGDKSDTIPGIKGFGPKDWENADKGVLAQVMADPAFSDITAAAAGLRPPHIKWLRENPDQVEAMRRVIAPLPMTDDQLNAALKPGVDNPVAREALMKEYIL